MLYITVPESELFDDDKQEFITTKAVSLQMEHSLVSISKWEERWRVSYIATKDKTEEQIYDYLRCMTITKNVNPLVYYQMTPENLHEIAQYVDHPMTATTISEVQKSKKAPYHIITAEVLYAWMIAYSIPFECQKWHLNKLIMLIRVIQEEAAAKEKKDPKEIMRRNKALNAARKAKHNTRG